MKVKGKAKVGCDYCSKPACVQAVWGDGSTHAACASHMLVLHCWSMSVKAAYCGSPE